MTEIPSEIHTSVKGNYKFIQIFAQDLSEAAKLTKEAIGALEDGGHFWLSYPKGASKKYKSDINREKSWEVLAPYDYKPVTLVAIDDEWSAMRFKHVDSIKEMKRKTAATEKGKERIK